jgi:Ca2+/Na+ antiporter
MGRANHEDGVRPFCYYIVMNRAQITLLLKKYRRYLLLLVVDSIFFGLLSPTTSAFVIIPAFILIILSIFSLLTLILSYIGTIMPIKSENQKRVVVMLTVSTAVIVALQSIGQLTVRDVVTIVPLILVLYLYMSYSKSRRV